MKIQKSLSEYDSNSQSSQKWFTTFLILAAVAGVITILIHNDEGKSIISPVVSILLMGYGIVYLIVAEAERIVAAILFKIDIEEIDEDEEVKN